MPRNAKRNRLQSLQQKAERLRLQIAEITARENVRRRKEDTRVKIIVGAAVLADAAVHEKTSEAVREIVARAVRTPRDRELLASRGLLRGTSPTKLEHRA